MKYRIEPANKADLSLCLKRNSEGFPAVFAKGKSEEWFEILHFDSVGAIELKTFPLGVVKDCLGMEESNPFKVRMGNMSEERETVLVIESPDKVSC